MDLFTPIVPEEAWHPNFAALVRHGNEFNAAVITDWAKGLVDRAV